MATFFLTIVPNLILKNNKHTVRIAVTHCRQTRYIPTDVTIDSEKEISNGRIVKRPDKERLNIHLMKLLSAYEERASNIPFANSLTCSQLIKIIKSPTSGEKHRTFSEIADEYLSQIDKDDRGKTYKLYRLAANRYMDFAGNDTLMEHITPIRINNYLMSLQKDKLSQTSINLNNS